MPAQWAAISRHAIEQTVRVALALDGGFIDKASLDVFLDRVIGYDPGRPISRAADPKSLIPLESKPGGLIKVGGARQRRRDPEPLGPGRLHGGFATVAAAAEAGRLGVNDGKDA
jgi:hypothetical protein